MSDSRNSRTSAVVVSIPDELHERPLPARSLIASLLLRSHPPRMRGGRLVQWCGLFGVAEGTARVALSRMVERGELRAHEGTYELAGRVHDRRAAQDWSLEPDFERWDETWRVAVVVPGPRVAADRTALRDAMRRLRFVELREGVWTRPDNLPRAAAPADAWAVVDEQCAWWSGSPDEQACGWATELFESAAWSGRARMLVGRLRTVTGALASGDDRALAAGFVTGAAALAHVRADPLLPAPLAADVGAGKELRHAYRVYEGEFSRALHAWFREH